MGGVRKPFLELLGQPILLRSIQPFLAHPQVVSVVVALGPEEMASPPEWLAGLDSRVSLVQGGATRGESVWSALQALPESVDMVAVHDAARPLVTGEILRRCLEAVGKDTGVVAGWPAVDTLKRVGEGNRVISTIPRSEVWHAQTPQIFPREVLFRAYREAMAVGIADTDDAALVERVGGRVLMVPGSPGNLKVTRPEDVPLAEHLLRQSERDPGS
jgi:2-C-methyl-D-erythritol 4-phosphate cytidylyltransferase